MSPNTSAGQDDEAPRPPTRYEGLSVDDTSSSSSFGAPTKHARGDVHDHDSRHERPYRRRTRRRSSTLDTTHLLYTTDEERKVVRQLDRKLVLFLACLYMLSFLDRSNIGNARLAGLEEDLNLKPAEYDWLLTAFYITYVSFEWMTLLYRVVPAHIYVFFCVLSWGVFASLQSIATSFAALLFLRLLLGLSEAAFSPGLPFYLSFFYRREELAFRTGLIISAAPLATSFAGSLAWLITRLGRYGPAAPWRLLFLVEGFPSVCVAFIAWFFIPDGPGTAGFLTTRDKRVAVLRLRNETDGQAAKQAQRGLDWSEMLETLADPKCYITAVSVSVCAYRIMSSNCSTNKFWEASRQVYLTAARSTTVDVLQL